MTARLVALLLLALTLAGCSGGGGGGSADDGADASGGAAGGDGSGGAGGDGADGGDSGDAGGDDTPGTSPLEGDVPAPTLGIGDSWTHRTTSTGAGGSVQSTANSEVKARETKDGVDAFRLFTEATTTSQGTTVDSTTTSWVRASDLATVRSETSTTYEIPGLGPSAQTVTTTYKAPCAQYQYPFGVGSSWTTTCTMESGGQETRVSWSRSVQAKESVTVPAGTFESYKVQVTSGETTSTEWYAPGACGVVKTTSSQGGNEVEMVAVEVDC